jgi:hypothetical protein
MVRFTHFDRSQDFVVTWIHVGASRANDELPLSAANHQTPLQIEELRTMLDVAQQRLQEANERLQAGMTGNKGTEQVLEERLKFETLLANISARFINLPADRIEVEIEDTQRRICEFLDVDRSTLWQVREEDPGTLLLTHFHRPSESPSIPERMNAREFFPWTTQKVLSGETVIIVKNAC